jgi:hypothetical protein
MLTKTWRDIFETAQRAPSPHNGDFNYVCTIAKDNTKPTVHFYEFATGPFARDKAKLKHEYVTHLTVDEYKDYGLVTR